MATPTGYGNDRSQKNDLKNFLNKYRMNNILEKYSVLLDFFKLTTVLKFL